MTIGQKELLRQEYISRINKVIDYIEKNIGSRLNLKHLSRVACFSSFHFHRIFSAMVGETLNSFIKRLRVEKAASMLVINPKYSITDIALKCGFSGSAVFSRAFKEHYGLSASEFRSGGYRQISKNCKTESNKGKERISSPHYIDSRTSILKGRLEMKVEVKQVPEMYVAYIRHIGPYKGDAGLFKRLSEKLFKWAGPRDLLKFPETRYLIIYHDDPEITEEDKLRVSVCITVPENIEVDGGIGKMVLSGGNYAMAHFEINADQFQEAWNSVYRDWLPESGYQPDDRPCFELYSGDCNVDKGGKFKVDICIPVKPL
jgi:AraC family transcriptional regulator